MIRSCLVLAAVIGVLTAPSVLAQSRGDVITPPATKPDGSVITPPAAHADPGIEKAKPREQSQLPQDEDKVGPNGAPAPKTDGKR